ESITSKGYPEENHHVTTQDGYILTLQRIPHGRNQRSSNAPREVVLLQHGLMGESTNFLDNLANESLAYILADSGADVWLSNSRGNSYSRAHVHLKPSQEIFWDWSFDEMAQYDLPAVVDYILAETGVSQITYIGHSQGTLIGFAGFSRNQTLGSKVKLFVALAPVAKVGHIRNFMRFIAPFAYDIAFLYHLFGRGEIMSNKLDLFLAKDVCENIDILCENVIFLIGGFNPGNLNKTRIPVYVAHNPSGTSVRNLIHYAQGVRTDTFQKFDFRSAEENIRHYGQPTPPVYHPEEMQTPVAIFRGNNDYLADPTDVQWLLPKLQNVVFDKDITEWEHMDFVLGMDAPYQCYDDIKRLIFTNNTIY
ncbi:hypothetical protein LOTGIDRAFT_142588, partial [Lottia gigantea]